MSQIGPDSYTKDSEGTKNMVGLRLKTEHKMELFRQNGMSDYKYYIFCKQMAIPNMHPNTAKGIRTAGKLQFLWKNPAVNNLNKLVAEGDIHWTAMLGEFEGVEIDTGFQT